MKSVQLEATSRSEVRKKSALNALRKEGRVPAVLYGGKENVNFHVNEIAFSKLITTHEVYFIDLTFGDKTTKAVISDVQFHPVTDKPIHIDFMEIFEDKPVTIGVPVGFTGASKGVLAGGKRREKLRKLTLRGLPANLPEVVSIDITNVKIGGSIKVKDISLDNVEMLDNENSVIIAVKTSRVAVEVDEEEEVEGDGEEATEEAAAE
jgi:large subunit ribosomal protein L25